MTYSTLSTKYLRQEYLVYKYFNSILSVLFMWINKKNKKEKIHESKVSFETGNKGTGYKDWTSYRCIFCIVWILLWVYGKSRWLDVPCLLWRGPGPVLQAGQDLRIQWYGCDEIQRSNDRKKSRCCWRWYSGYQWGWTANGKRLRSTGKSCIYQNVSL